MVVMEVPGEKKMLQMLFLTYQKWSHHIISKHNAISKSHRTIIFKETRTQESEAKPHLQDNEGREVGKGIVWNVCDLVEGQRHGLQGRQGVECRHWDFC